MTHRNNFFFLLKREDISLAVGFSGFAFGLLPEFSILGKEKLYITLGVTLVVMIVLYLFRYYESIKAMIKDGYRFGKSNSGEYALEELKKAKDSIVVTHFSGFDPKNEDSHYVDAMTKKISEGVTLRRIIPEEKSNEEWLKEFRDEYGNCKKNYFEDSIKQEDLFPLFIDFMVFDEKTVVFHFPTSKYRDYGDDPYALVIRNNEDLARRLLMLEKAYRGLADHNKSSKRDAVTCAPS
jgi:hypothetical protein